MILYLHGRSLRGDNLNQVKRYGPPAFLDRKPHFPFVVVSPQLPDHSWPSDSLLKLLDEVTGKYKVDRNRIYLTGVSMGGAGSWYLAAADQKRFAAMAPLCGYGGTSLARQLTDIPIWAFHGKLDKLVPIEPHQKLADAVNKAGGKCRFTVIPDGDHGNIIFPTYRRSDLYQWFLSHSRSLKNPITWRPKPLSITAKTQYTVKKGDSLWRIGKKHGVSVDQLKKENRLKSIVLQIGQKLVIPKKD